MSEVPGKSGICVTDDLEEEGSSRGASARDIAFAKQDLARVVVAAIISPKDNVCAIMHAKCTMKPPIRVFICLHRRLCNRYATQKVCSGYRPITLSIFVVGALIGVSRWELKLVAITGPA